MRINVHGHIFNFRSVLTTETLHILLNRLGAEGWPPFLVSAAEKALSKLLKGDYVDEQGLLSELVGSLNADKNFKKWLKDLGEDIPGDVHVLAHGNLDGLLAGAARELLHKLDTFLSSRDDVEKQNIQDFVAFLLLGIRHSIPAHWDSVLEKHPNLRVCFGHFGGDENLVAPSIPSDSWTDRIIRLMAKYTGVYADISYHTACMDGGAATLNYFHNLAAILNQATTRTRVLFGSDFYLVRLRLREDNLWRFFETNFTAPHWERLTRTNPARFLGITGSTGTGLDKLGSGTPNSDGGPRKNILNHLSWLSVHPAEVGRVPHQSSEAVAFATIGFPTERTLRHGIPELQLIVCHSQNRNRR